MTLSSDDVRSGETSRAAGSADDAGTHRQEVRAESVKSRRPSRVASVLIGSVERFSGLYAIAVIFVVFALWVPETFLTKTTWQGLVAQQAVTAMLAFAMLIPLSAGVFDLSIAAVLGLAETFAAWLQGVHHVSPLMSVVYTLALCGVVGVVNAIAVVSFKVSSFIATLGMTSILGAVVVALTNQQEVIVGVSTGFQKLGNVSPLGIPIVAYYMVVLGTVIWWFMERTPKGRYMAAIGGNQEAARLAGIRVHRYLAVALILPGLLAGLTGLIYLAQIGSGSASAGPPFLLPVFAGVFLGATQVKPGRFNVLGTLVAVFLLAIGVKGLQLVGAPNWVSDLFNGAALIIAVALANLRRRSHAPID